MEKIRQKIRDIIFQKISRKREVFKKFFSEGNRKIFVQGLGFPKLYFHLP